MFFTLGSNPTVNMKVYHESGTEKEHHSCFLVFILYHYHSYCYSVESKIRAFVPNNFSD